MIFSDAPKFHGNRFSFVFTFDDFADSKLKHSENPMATTVWTWKLISWGERFCEYIGK